MPEGDAAAVNPRVLGVHTFSPGEYVSIRDHGGELHTLVVMFVEAVAK